MCFICNSSACFHPARQLCFKHVFATVTPAWHGNDCSSSVFTWHNTLVLFVMLFVASLVCGPLFAAPLAMGACSVCWCTCNCGIHLTFHSIILHSNFIPFLHAANIIRIAFSLCFGCLLSCCLFHIANPFYLAMSVDITFTDTTSSIPTWITAYQLEWEYSLAGLYVCSCVRWWSSARRLSPVLPRLCDLCWFPTVLCRLSAVMQIWKNDESHCHRS